MVSMRHEILVELFKNRPTLAAELLVESLHMPVPAYEEGRVVSVELNDVQPAEYRADLVVVLYRDNKPTGINIIEVQLAADPDKRFAWPAYLVNGREKYRCPAELLVVAPDATVANWCEQPIEIGVPGFVLKPPVLKQEFVPKITDVVEAIKRPELALLSAMAYGDSEEVVEIGQAALEGFASLPPQLGSFYSDVLYNAINEAARRALEVKMKDYVYTNPYARELIQLGRDEGVTLGRDEGVKFAARSLLTVLRTRGFDIPEPVRLRILAERDMARLDSWLERAIVAASIAEVLAEPS